MTELACDIAKETFVACFDLGDKRPKLEFKNTDSGRKQLLKWLEKHDVTDIHLFFEATGKYGDALATWAFERGWKVTVLNPLRARRFAEARGILNKTDGVDSGCILDFAKSVKTGSWRLWKPRSRSENELKEIHTEILGLLKMIGQEKNRLDCGIQRASVKQRIQRNIQYLKQQVTELEAEALKVIKQDQKLNSIYKVLISMKGIGNKTATAILARVNFDDFKKGRQLVAFAGLAPRKWESGTSVRKREMISRVGHADLRSALYWPAVVAMTHDPDMKAFKLHLLAQGKPKMVIICAVMSRLLRQAFAKVRDSRKAPLEAIL